MNSAITKSLRLPLIILAFHVLSPTAFAAPPTITVQPQISSFALLSKFQGANVGTNPQASLIQGTDGRLYGTTFFGGDANSDGTLYAVNPDGTGFTTLYRFTNGNDGSGPAGNLIQGIDGRLYGTASSGGADSNGTVFALNPDGTGFTTLYSFNPANGIDGSSPNAGLIQGTDGRLYGTTTQGGANSFGTVFAVNPNGTGFTALYSFAGGNDGANPTADLIQGTDGRLYGTASAGGANGFGALFSVNLDGTGFTTLYSFTNGNDGSSPQAGLIQGTSGRLYGTTSAGGATGNGTVFAVNPIGTGFTALYSFTNGNDGAVPVGRLIQGTDGRLYGTTQGAVSSFGTVFTMNTDGTGFATLYTFTNGNDGAAPQAGLIQGTDVRFYGTTTSGGAGNGTVFAISTNSAIAGTTAAITVTATGTAPLSYQWKFNGVNIPGATSATLTLANITGANAGSYSVVVSNLEGSVPSNPVTLTVILPSTPSAPVFAPAPGTYSTAQPVFITSAGATHIYYTVNGSAPTTTSTLYTGPVPISATTTLRAIGVDAGGSSPVTSGTYTILPPSAPIFSTAPGTYSTAQSVLITSVHATHIYYTIDGSTPTTASILYTGPVLVSATTTLRAIGVDAAGSSPVTSGTYTILPPSAPVFSPAPGIYSTAQSVSITSANAISIYYTTDGSTPTIASTLYSGPFLVSTTATLRAIGVDGAGSSAVTSGTFAIGISTTPPVIHSITATPGILTPPDNRLVPVTVTVNATDVSDPLPVSKIIAVSSNEAADHDVDWQVTGPLTLNLRAERDHHGDGIVYTITIQTSDIFGHTTTGTTQVIVPKDSDALEDRPDITADPKSQTVAEGTDVTFTVSVAPALPVTYQWRFNRQAIAGAAGASLTLHDVTLADAGDYTVVVTNGNGSTTSDEADLKVLPLPPVITHGP